MHARPSLVNCEAEVGNCLVFRHEDSLLFFSLKQNSLIKKVPGGEAFIDLTFSENSSKATLTYLQGAS